MLVDNRLGVQHNAEGARGHRVLPSRGGGQLHRAGDGTHVLPLATSQDHKRLLDGDAGPNTGGMGAHSPAPVVTPAVHARALREVIEPTVRAMAAEGTPYTGFLYAGLMVAPDGSIQTLEFNCRMGSDPETQPILMRLRSDLVEVLAGHRWAAGHRPWTGIRASPWAWWWPRRATCPRPARGMPSPRCRRTRRMPSSST